MVLYLNLKRFKIFPYSQFTFYIVINPHLNLILIKFIFQKFSKN